MKRYSLVSILFAISLIMTGCGNSGAFIASNTTQVELSEGNYRVVATNVSGSAETAYIFGGSISWGITTDSFGLIPLGGSDMLYKDAREALWNEYEDKNSSVTGKKLALVNIQYDAKTVNYFIYTKAAITITADVVEFE